MMHCPVIGRKRKECRLSEEPFVFANAAPTKDEDSPIVSPNVFNFGKAMMKPSWREGAMGRADMDMGVQLGRAALRLASDGKDRQFPAPAAS